MLAPWKKNYDQPRQHIKKQRYYFANKGPSSQGYGFSNSHVWMWELDYKESWALQNWCFWTVVLEKTLENPLDCKETQPVNPKENQSWIFIGRTDAEAETPILWSPDVKNWLIWKDPGAGKDGRWEEKGTTEDEMVGWAWVCVGSRSWWWIGRPGMLQSMGPQKARHNWGIELNWMVALVINAFPSTLEKKNLAPGNSLVVRWLGLCALIAKGWGSISGGELRSCKPLVWQKKKKKKKRTWL